MIIWSGVYKSFSDTGALSTGFHNPIWYSKQVTKITSLIEQIHEKANSLNLAKEYPLEIVVAMLLSNANKIRVLDFGGGMGEYYFRTVSKIPNRMDDIFFDVIESTKTLEHLPKNVKKYTNLNYYSQIPEGVHYSIVHFGSVMQYIEEWTTFLKNVTAQVTPEYLVFSDLTCGSNPTFVTTQKYYDEFIPVQFYNSEEFIAQLRELNFETCYQSFLATEILGHQSLSDLSDHPKTHQIKNTMNIIFKRVRKHHIKDE